MSKLLVMEKTLLTTKQVSERLGVSQERVRQLIIAGRLPSQQFGRDHLIEESDLALVSDRPVGRPKKEGAAVVANGAQAATKPTKKGTKK